MKQTRGILRNTTNVMTNHHNHCQPEFDESSGSKVSTKSSTSVSFESITIREYAVTIGDNPSCSSGAPISIDWSYNEKATVPIEDYEKYKPPRREKSELKMPSEIRNNILQEWDYSLSRILMASTEAQNVRNQRSKSAQTFTQRQIVRNGIKGFCNMPKVLYRKASRRSGKKTVDADTDCHAASACKSTRRSGSWLSQRRKVEIPTDFPIQASESADDVLEDESMGDSGSSEDDLSYGSLEENDDLSATHHRHNISFDLKQADLSCGNRLQENDALSVTHHRHISFEL
jgi:hypothetical protein